MSFRTNIEGKSIIIAGIWLSEAKPIFSIVRRNMSKTKQGH